MSVDPRPAPLAPGPPQFQSSLSRQRRSTGAPIAVLILLAALASGVLLLEGIQDPIGLIVAVPLTALAMGLVLACYFWLDRWEPEPSRLLLLAFLWGASVAIVISLVLELASSEVLGRGLVLTLVGPAIEEAAKGAFLLVMLTGARRREFDGVVDGLVYAGFAAVGFAFVEDIGYIAQSFSQGTETTIATVVMRLVMAPFAHPLFTSMIGLGVGLAVSRPRQSARWRYPLLGYLAAVTLHALWNGSLTFGFGGYLLVYVVIMIPAFVGALLIARYHRARERDVVKRQLPELVYYRLVTPAEAGWLDSIAARRAWLRSVTARSGKPAAQALRDFQAAATELAFLRDRVQRGVGPADAYQLHAELVQALLTSRAKASGPLIENAKSAPPIPPVRPASLSGPGR
ncbi:MAG TPA: PrsW family intramembrane metalloprotease [Jatrophihabitans sp.]|jgi:RsiW-degrading membrane proteinase PrsW (M82 family)|uniref:PrsW family intramembrane metalloprotease n=1 Tax=Jatrophihabitans sp. TaxID=1932789 RepID=UPI002F158760